MPLLLPSNLGLTCILFYFWAVTFSFHPVNYRITNFFSLISNFLFFFQKSHHFRNIYFNINFVYFFSNLISLLHFISKLYLLNFFFDIYMTFFFSTFINFNQFHFFSQDYIKNIYVTFLPQLQFVTFFLNIYFRIFLYVPIFLKPIPYFKNFISFLIFLLKLKLYCKPFSSKAFFFIFSLLPSIKTHSHFIFLE